MLTPELFQKYANDFAVFCDDAMIPTPLGTVRFGDVMHPPQRKLIEALAPSLLAVALGTVPATPKFWAEMAKSWGKDLIAALAIIWLLIFTRHRARIQLAAADQDQADETHRWVVGVVLVWPWLAELLETPNYRIVCKTTSSEAEVLAADTAGSHGAVGVNLLILNELHAVQKWTFIENCQDNASKNSAALTIALTNAGFKAHPAWKLREIARTSPRWSFHQVCEPPPHVDPAEIEESSRRNSAERHNRLWYSVWSDGGGDTLSADDIEAAIDRKLGPLLPGPEHRSGMTLIGGLDLGWKKDHSGFVVLAAVHKHRRIRLAWAQAWAPARRSGGEVDLQAVKAAVIKARRDYGMSACYFDPSQAALLSQECRQAGVNMVPMDFVASNLNRMATTLLDVFRSRCVDLYPDARLIADLRRLTIIEKTFGLKLESTRDATGHCDVGTAFACAAPACVEALSHGGTSAWGGTITSTRSQWSDSSSGGYRLGVSEFGINGF